jgi:hypothetical protein
LSNIAAGHKGHRECRVTRLEAFSGIAADAPRSKSALRELPFMEVFMTQSEEHGDRSVEERSVNRFKSERSEDLAPIGLTALLVLTVLLRVRD